MMYDALFGLMMLGGFFALGISMWALGQWLRRKGFGPQLDVLDQQYTALQYRVNRLTLPAAARFYRGLNTYNRLPLFGSKHQLVLIERVRMAIVQMAQEEKAQQADK